MNLPKNLFTFPEQMERITGGETRGNARFSVFLRVEKVSWLVGQD